MSPKIFIDTLFVVALVNQRDQFHAQARDLAKTLDGHAFLTTEAVLLEIGNGLARHFKDSAIEIIDHFCMSADVELIHLSPGLFKEGFDLFRTHRDKEWGLVDCISFVVMRHEGLQEALTFDQHFQQAGFTALMRP